MFNTFRKMATSLALFFLIPGLLYGQDPADSLVIDSQLHGEVRVQAIRGAPALSDSINFMLEATDEVGKQLQTISVEISHGEITVSAHSAHFDGAYSETSIQWDKRSRGYFLNASAFTNQHGWESLEFLVEERDLPACALSAMASYSDERDSMGETIDGDLEALEMLEFYPGSEGINFSFSDDENFSRHVSLMAEIAKTPGISGAISQAFLSDIGPSSSAPVIQSVCDDLVTQVGCIGACFLGGVCLIAGCGGAVGCAGCAAGLGTCVVCGHESTNCDPDDDEGPPGDDDGSGGGWGW